MDIKLCNTLKWVQSLGLASLFAGAASSGDGDDDDDILLIKHGPKY